MNHTFVSNITIEKSETAKRICFWWALNLLTKNVYVIFYYLFCSVFDVVPVNSCSIQPASDFFKIRFPEELRIYIESIMNMSLKQKGVISSFISNKQTSIISHRSRANVNAYHRIAWPKIFSIWIVKSLLPKRCEIHSFVIVKEPLVPPTSYENKNVIPKII